MKRDNTCAKISTGIITNDASLNFTTLVDMLILILWYYYTYYYTKLKRKKREREEDISVPVALIRNMSSVDNTEDELISLIPGTNFTVTSGFRDAKINMLSTKILRIALLICIYQVILTIIFISLLLIENATAGAAVRLLDLVCNFVNALFELTYFVGV